MKTNTSLNDQSTIEHVPWGEAQKVTTPCVSKRVRTVAKILCAVLPVAALLNGLINGDRWYMVLLYILSGIVVAIAGSGVFVFLLKPFFFFVRKRALQRAEQAEVLSGDFALNKLNGIDENTNSDSALLAQQYRHNVTEISQRNMEIYALVAKCDQYAEWKWVVAGIIAACMVIAIVVWIYVLAVMLVLLMVITAFLATHPAYDDHYYNDQVSREEDPWIARIFERLWNKIKEKENEANARISTLSSEVLALQAENDTILKQLFSPEDICQIN